jgi:hypothetical protein
MKRGKRDIYKFISESSGPDSSTFPASALLPDTNQTLTSGFPYQSNSFTSQVNKKINNHMKNEPKEFFVQP